MVAGMKVYWLVVVGLAAIQLAAAAAASQPPAEEVVVDRSQVERKMIIIVADEQETTTPATPISTKATQDCKEKPQISETRFKIDETTKLIYIDKRSESGLLIGETVSSIQSSNQTTKSEQSNSRANSGDITKNPTVNNNNKDSPVSGSTNYSVYLVSRQPEHIAILLDIEEIDFEPTLNCDNQEIRFSIIGEISKQLLDQKENEGAVDSSSTTNGSGNGGAAAAAANDDQSAPGTSAQEGESQESQETQEESDNAASSLPVSEAMALLLNSPLNKTILDESDGTNDFKIIESTLDYLHQKTCQDLIAQQEAAATAVAESSNIERHDGNARRNQTRRRKSKKGRNESGGRKRLNHNRRRQQQRLRQVAEQCQHNSAGFKNLMSERLRDYFEWDDFKVVCGKIKQLVIPMRSLKISVYSDEFSPNSSFKLRYKFISDPAQLPAYDNGKYYCRNRNIIDLSLKCNGIDDCGDASDESIKTCGYPTSRNGELTSSLVTARTSGSVASALNNLTTYSSSSKKKLTYVNGDVLHCCQPNEWLNLMPHGQTNRLNLQSLIGESMNIFAGGPIFAPTNPRTGSKGKGKRRVKRIVGGGVAQKGMWPGQASLQYELLEPLCHFCAGTLIHPQYVLTAGHCITKDGLSRGIKVVFGAHDLRQVSGSHIQVRYVDDAQIYPGVDVKQLNFDWENDMNNDIALLRLNAPVLVTPHVAPACLPPFNTPPTVNTTCRSIGWGQTHGSGNSNLLKHLSLKVVDSANCSKELIDQLDNDGETSNSTSAKLDGGRANLSSSKHSRRVGEHFESSDLNQYSDKTMVCVKNDAGHGICQGDSGGPLYCDRVNEMGEKCTEIYGVASFIIQYSTIGAMCAVENLPEIFGEVSSKTEWISSTIKMFEQTYKLKYS